MSRLRDVATDCAAGAGFGGCEAQLNGGSMGEVFVVLALADYRFGGLCFLGLIDD